MVTSSPCIYVHASEDQLTIPRPSLPSIQVNMRAGNLPPEENNGTTYLKVPIKNYRN